jgi:ABC-2 type transport system permease protein
MAVYKHNYRVYSGEITPRWSRFLILTRYSARGIFESKILIALFAVSLFYPLLCTVALYLNHNTSILAAVKFSGDHLFDIDGNFFMLFLTIQSSLAFLLTAIIGPGLVAPDLANNALPLYFCRPLSRAEYVIGRGCVIVFLLSFVTWVPGLLLFGVETTLAGYAWGWANRSFAAGIFVGGWIWIIFLALLALAISAWVRWKIVAGGLLLGVMFVNAGFAEAFNGILRTKAGHYFDVAALNASIWANFFGVDLPTHIPTANACLTLGLICGLLILILQRKVRAFEVIR